ncbi:MAG: serine protease [Chloroflexaceae bacterium]|nr:serine protease [Chloroflexaceae bacterium]
MTIEAELETERDPVTTDLAHGIDALVRRVLASVVRVVGQGQGVGSGVVWRINGGIVTNDHVVAAHAGGVAVELDDGRVRPATVAARHPAFDLALLHVEGVAPGELRMAATGTAAHLRVGELVFAVGNPYGQRNIVTAGIVSGFGEARLPSVAQPLRYILSDVLLRPGNSGGPLVNAYGGVVGINAMIRGGDLAVAIPTEVVQAWLNDQDQIL